MRDFAEEAITPVVASMDENGRLEPTLLPKLFDLGLMGIEIPEAYGGPGGTFFMSCLAIEELSRVDAAVAVVVDVHNTLVTNAVLRWGHRRAARRLPAHVGEARHGFLFAVGGRRWQRCFCPAGPRDAPRAINTC